MVIQVKHVAFDLSSSHKFGNPTASDIFKAHLKKFVISNSALRQLLQFENQRIEENTEYNSSANF